MRTQVVREHCKVPHYENTCCQGELQGPSLYENTCCEGELQGPSLYENTCCEGALQIRHAEYHCDAIVAWSTTRQHGILPSYSIHVFSVVGRTQAYL